jgi:Putative Ig domain
LECKSANATTASWAYRLVLIPLIFSLTGVISSCGSIEPANTRVSSSSQQIKITLVSDTLPPATVGSAYDAVISVSGGMVRHAFFVLPGTLPPGLKLDSASGSIFGSPTVAGIYTFTVTVRDVWANNMTPRQSSASAERQLAIEVVPKTKGSPVIISISPNNANVSSGSTQQFTAAASNTPNSGVSWWASVGTIAENGVFTAPNVSTNTAATVTVTSLADSSKQATAAIVVTPPTNGPPVSIHISPASAAVSSGGTQQFIATVNNTNNAGVTWQASTGTISANGLYTSPGVSTDTPATVKATSNADSSQQATATIMVNAALTPPSIQTSTLPDAVDGTPYAAELSATGGKSPYLWNIVSGALPQGLQLDSSSGTISGTTTVSGAVPFTAMVTDAASQSTTRQLTLLATAGTGGAAVIPSTFLGLQSKATNGTYPTVSFGATRLWDRDVDWATLNPVPGSYNWTNVDGLLARLKTHGLSDGVNFTIGVVPTWASSVPTDTACDFGSPGGCDLPADLNPDGTGTNAIFIAFVQNLAQHLNDSVYLQTHAHVKYWEPWNEWYRNPVLGPANQGCISSGSCSLHATYAQMVRMSEDLRCVVAGKGTVNGVPCNRQAIDPNALIVAPASHGRSHSGVAIMENFLHCDDSPSVGSQCTTGDRGRNAIDILNFHFYTMQSETAEEVNMHTANIKSFIRASDLVALPLWSNEGGWGYDTSLADPDLQAAFVMRYYMLGWSNKISLMMWYEFENSGWGTLYAPRINGNLTPAGIAYQRVYDWMVGNAMTQSCTGPAFPNVGVWTCGLTKPDGTRMLAVWDSSQSCTSGSCTSSYYTYDALYTIYATVEGGRSTVLAGGTVPIGAKPILLSQ